MTTYQRGATLKLVQLAREAGSDGIVAADAQGKVQSDYVANLLSNASRNGSLWRVMVKHRWRYFASPEWARSYAALRGLVVDGVGSRAPGHKRANDQAFQPPRVGPPRGPAHESGDPVVTPRTRIVCRDAPVDTRYAPQHAPRVVDARECRDWAKEVAR